MSNYEELAALHGELYYALDVVPADHAEVPPEDLAFLVQEDRTAHVHGSFSNQDLQYSLIIGEHRLRNSLWILN